VITIKLKFFILVLLVLAIGLYPIFYPDTSQEKEVQILKSKLNEYEMKEHIEKVEEERIKALIDPQIIIDKLESVCQLITYKGNATYSNYIQESKFYGSRSLTYKFTYEFGIGMDLSHIKVKTVHDDTVILTIPKRELDLLYLELKEDKLKSDNTWFASEFDPELVNVLRKQAKETVRDDVLNNREVFDKGLESLKRNIMELVRKLGFEEVVIEEI
jgi:hypothetical protein